MKRFKKILIWLGVIAVAFFLFLLWYRATYSMGIAASYEINDPTLKERVLIATQDSEFKNGIVDNVVSEIRERPVYIRVIDVTELDGVDPKIWSVIVILHTWEMGEAQKNAKAFIERADDANLIVLATSGDGSNHIDGADGLTSASVISDVTRISDDIVQRIDRKIK